jgi:hypothetical protein
MTGVGDVPRSSVGRGPGELADLLGRRVRYRGVTGHVQEVDALGVPHVVILAPGGVLMRVEAAQWAEIEVLR